MLSLSRCILAVGVVAGALLGGCSSPPEPEDVSALTYEGGDITEAEYVALVTASQQCMAEKGYDVGPVELRDDQLTYGYSIYGGQVGDTSASQDIAECEQPLNFAEAEIAYQEQHVLSGAERERVQAEFLTCLEDAGVAGVTADDSLEQITDRILQLQQSGEDTDAAMVCVNQYGSRLFGAGR